jgi:hypothetical protein
MFVVRNERHGVVVMYALASDASAERDRLVSKTGRNHTVSYCPREIQTFNLSAHIIKVDFRSKR